MTDNKKQLRPERAALDFLEEVLWALSSKDPVVLKKGLKELRHSLSDSKSKVALTRSTGRQADKSRFLIGVLPELLGDEELFASNQSIEKFAREAFGVSISRWEKRSRYEMIGMLVMEVRLLPQNQLVELFQLLEKLVAKDPGLARLKKDSVQVGFSWNETIRKLGA